MPITIAQSNTQVASNSVANGKKNVATDILQAIEQIAKNFASLR